MRVDHAIQDGLGGLARCVRDRGGHDVATTLGRFGEALGCAPAGRQRRANRVVSLPVRLAVHRHQPTRMACPFLV